VVDELTGAGKSALSGVTGWISTIGWVAVGLAALIIIGLIYVLTKGKFEGAGLKVG
jgi:hypothetical protein